MDEFQLHRMRALRRDSYRCQHRDCGIPCLRPSAKVVYLDPNGDVTVDNLTTVCSAH